MSSTLTDVQTGELLRLVHGDKVLVRYLISRPDRSCNFQSFYAEVIDWYQLKKTNEGIVRCLKFNLDVDLQINQRNLPGDEVPPILNYVDARARFVEMLAGWEHFPGAWRTDLPFVGVLRIGEERIVHGPTSVNFLIYHGHIEATLRGLAQAEYCKVGAVGDLTQYHALQQAHAKFNKFAAVNSIKRTLQAFNEM